MPPIVLLRFQHHLIGWAFFLQPIQHFAHAMHQLSYKFFLVLHLSLPSYPTGDPLCVSTILAICRGSFNVGGKGKPHVSFHGFQANLSNRALLKVREATKRLQQPLLLEELPRGSDYNSWPIQFQKVPPINDNIALYFFASGKERWVISHLLSSDT
jgi:hypothetical protein